MMQHLIETYGYAAVLLGTFFEGETVLIAAAFAAHRGYLYLPYVIGLAFVGSLLGDQCVFYLGRKHRAYMLRRFPRWRQRMEKVERLLVRHETMVILSFRFLYGLRSVTPFALGAGSVGRLKFLILNAMGSLAWALAISLAGFYFTAWLEGHLGDLRHMEQGLFLLIIAGGVGSWLVYLWRTRRRNPVVFPDAPP